VLDILAEFVPSMIHLWGMYSNASHMIMPDFAKDLGIVDELYFHIMMHEEEVPTYYLGYSKGYEDGYDYGFHNDGSYYDNPYEYDDDWNYDRGLHDGWNSGFNDGDYDGDYSYWGDNYYNMYENYPEYERHSRPSFITPPLLYTPTTFSFEDVYDDFFLWDEINFTEAQFQEACDNISIDVFDVTTHEIQIEWNVDGTDDIFFDTLGVQEQFEDLLDEIGDNFSIQFKHNTVYAKAILHWRYGTDGVLDNYHIHYAMGVQTTDDEWLEYEVEFDISGGTFDVHNGAFTGEPLDIEHPKDESPEEPTDDPGFNNPFGDIPGYEMVFLAIAALGTAGLLLFRKRR
jgi:hypothetical protein